MNRFVQMASYLNIVGRSLKLIQMPPALYYDRKGDKHYSNTEELKQNYNFNGKNIISISPGGWQGFYMLGITKYIRDHYDLKDFIYTGASAGAWNSLFFSYKKDHNELYNTITKNLEQSKHIAHVETDLKHLILAKYSSRDFSLDKMFLTVTTLRPYIVQTHVYFNFHSLEDAIDCCIASSHIPFVTSTRMVNRYDGRATFDGGLSMFPYLDVSHPRLHITPNLWNKTSFQTMKPYNRIDTLVNQGYYNTQQNAKWLDEIFHTNKSIVSNSIFYPR